MKTSELTAVLKAAGCYLKESRKKHDKWINPSNSKTAMVPRHGSKEVKPGTCANILKSLGLR